jgi:UV DNA damage repair endonuclease
MQEYKKLPDIVKRRLVLENDDRLFSLRDVLYVHSHTKAPVLFDTLHHECFNNGEHLDWALKRAFETWDRVADGAPMVDYSSQGKKEKERNYGVIFHFSFSLSLSLSLSLFLSLFHSFFLSFSFLFFRKGRS